MTPAGRIEAAIELLGQIETPLRPADQVAAEYFRARRYVGSKDRRAIADLLYGIVRARARLDWWLAQSKFDGLDVPRGRMIAWLALVEGWDEERLETVFDERQYHPKEPSAAERRLAKALHGHTLDHPRQPAPVKFEVPEWLYPRLAARFGTALETELAALQEEAPLDLRVNALKATREEARAALARDGIAAEPTPLSPLGLRVRGRANIAATDAFRAGLIEVQDEGSQLAALLVDARPGQRVCDFCAGAGGKTLALAARMGNKGQILALDVREGRIERAAQRLRRAGVHNVTRRVLASQRDPWVKRHRLGFDRVLVDAPCTGCGTWRRNPDAKWNLRESDLAELAALQADILDSAARLVKPGGRLVYATCSLLPEEDEGLLEGFLGSHADFRPLPAAQIWAEALGGAAPANPYSAGPALLLSPGSHKTDGFFIAVLERG
ncbi:MAG TPA: RsmB/NOP family class I SAM-dependent RNA methyltransferase [Alphaproteobacteria bacterium]|nr:RsmB/NOP family class I SAM-dependent RNA methyltransferase [Alphaproteobacteria bacterium]